VLKKTEDRQKVQRRKVRIHRLCRRQAALHGASRATRPQMEYPQRRRATNQGLIQWRVTELYDARWRRRRRGCREDCVFYATDRQKVQRRKVRVHRLCRRPAALHGASGATRPQMECPQRRRTTNHRIFRWRVTELYAAPWRRRRRRCREDHMFWGF